MKDNMEFIPIIKDILFKEALAHKDNRDFLEYFLETFLELKTGSLHNKLTVNYESHFGKWQLSDKSMRGDIIIKYDNTTINLEAYTKLNKKGKNKSTYYIMRIFSTTEAGDEYENNQKFIQINIVDGVVDNILPDELHSRFILYDANTNASLIEDNFEIHYFRIDVAKKIPYNKNDEIVNILKFIGAKNEKERNIAMKGNKKLIKLHNWICDYIENKRFKEFMDNWNYRVMQEEIKDLTLEEVARNLLKMQMPISDISKATGLSIDDIQNLIFSE